MKTYGESAKVCVSTAESWKERLPEIMEKFSIQDIFNMDETGCSLPEKGLV